ncbi:MAG: hypothetical protein V4568_13010 [Pseudomonadota bacterium]
MNKTIFLKIRSSAVQSGQSLVEYLVVTAFVVVILMVPYEHGLSSLEIMEQAVKDYYEKFSYAISLPVMPVL